MRILCIVSCSDRKIWDRFPGIGPVKAREAYIGSLTKAAIQYAEKHCGSWVILSAKYGFLWPDDIVPGPYNVSFRNRSTNPIGVEELIKQAREKGLYDYDVVVVFGGKDYVEIVKKVFRDKKVVDPLKGLRYGEKVKRLKESITLGKPLIEGSA